ncbi:Basic proline-rich protein precursor [Pseudomonas batumici]|uniref:Basic proline-rich protein n=1 Tax=Pseudomonas batumici TaxID=226910 RepID=A0A0C2I3S8_9PSED|nr:Basic proline-rich protein precursor [Pseudomonas batumici]
MPRLRKALTSKCHHLSPRPPERKHGVSCCPAQPTFRLCPRPFRRRRPSHGVSPRRAQIPRRTTGPGTGRANFHGVRRQPAGGPDAAREPRAMARLRHLPARCLPRPAGQAVLTQPALECLAPVAQPAEFPLPAVPGQPAGPGAAKRMGRDRPAAAAPCQTRLVDQRHHGGKRQALSLQAQQHGRLLHRLRRHQRFPPGPGPGGFGGVPRRHRPAVAQDPPVQVAATPVGGAAEQRRRGAPALQQAAALRRWRLRQPRPGALVRRGDGTDQALRLPDHRLGCRRAPETGVRRWGAEPLAPQAPGRHHVRPDPGAARPDLCRIPEESAGAWRLPGHRQFPDRTARRQRRRLCRGFPHDPESPEARGVRPDRPARSCGGTSDRPAISTAARCAKIPEPLATT